ncbi:MAG: replication initiation protein [Paucibacter sp.]|nr:replication initiation protein [Roseateles sp.]
MNSKPEKLVSARLEPIELRKPHEMIVMLPITNRLTLTGRRIYNSLLQVSQLRLTSMSSMPPANFVFEAPLISILRSTGSAGEDRTAAKRYLNEMLGFRVEWHAIAPGEITKQAEASEKTRPWHGLNLLSQVTIDVRNGENWVSWAFPPLIMNALSLGDDGARWAQIDLNVLSSLSTYTSVALYDICARFRDNPGGATTKKPLNWWIDALSQGPSGSERRLWRKFKSEKIKIAVDEINELTDLEIELFEDKKGGRAVVEAQFLVRRKQRSAQSSKFTGNAEVDANLVLRAETLGVRESKLESLLKEFGEVRVSEKIDALERRTAKGGLKAIENTYAYLRSLLRHDDAKPEVEPEESTPPPTADTSLVPAVNAIPVRTQGDIDAERIAALKAEILELPAARRQGYVDAAVRELTEKRLLNAVIQRRVGQGDVLHGLLGSVIVRLYGIEAYGEEWMEAPPTSLI